MSGIAAHVEAELATLQRQLDRCDPEALIDLLLANRKRTVTRLRTALADLRADIEAQAAIHERLAALLAPRTP